MSDRDCSFIDTNVWLYGFIANEPSKTAIAKELVHDSNVAVSVQVINEVCVNLIRKARLSEPDIRALIESFYARYHVGGTDRDLLVKASALRERYSLSFWDSMIVASALRCGATRLYTEDLQHGMIIESTLTVTNPFFGM